MYFNMQEGRAATWIGSLTIVMLLLLVLLFSSYFFPVGSLVAQEDSKNEGNMGENNINVDMNNTTSLSDLYPFKLLESGVSVDTFPIGIAVNPNTKKTYVANEYSNTISVLNTETQKVQKRINVGVFPYGIGINPLNNRVYVTNRGSNSVSVIDGSIDTKLLDIAVGKSLLA